MMNDFKKISIIGLGLIGGSIALALKNSGFKGQIIGRDLNSDNIKVAKELQVVDIFADSIKESVEHADLIIIATPLRYYESIFKEMSTHIKGDTIITDVGSVKGYVHKLANTYLPANTKFIGGHPMAGSEKSGISASNPYMFENAYYFLTLDKQDVLSEELDKLKKVIEAIGAYPVVTSLQKHDKIVARISHTPHLMAVILANLLDFDKNISYIPYVGGGFRDTTRIASGNPDMWRDIFLSNKEELISSIESCEILIKEFKDLLVKDDSRTMDELLRKAKLIRESIPKHRKDSMPQVFEVFIGVEDKPGMLGDLTRLLGEQKINIKDIEILHAREDEQGAIKIGFKNKEEQMKAYTVFKNANYHLTFIREENESANNE
ncbi:prephenate dehydrogenase [Serpentinicella alkaliphila]|uniref:Prephenate dehydrogenase n=2 Tax=Serpentinicella alkaliphila TaxID=1734049 RepID=A0A4R2U0A9_9FIRM|nr:prephenate dehydrogenase [Serpentinicella alkaliphila]QUH24834.1 prephenate dehydrogenase [Serpentinicella alkaliphila]TCQ03459.1 prephenate dehydrogenase [Serpentinicella alkaliphila]